MLATAGAVGNMAAGNQPASYADHFSPTGMSYLYRTGFPQMSEETPATYQHTLAFIRVPNHRDAQERLPYTN